jgi:hypothetical protein
MSHYIGIIMCIYYINQSIPIYSYWHSHQMTSAARQDAVSEVHPETCESFPGSEVEMGGKTVGGTRLKLGSLCSKWLKLLQLGL